MTDTAALDQAFSDRLLITLSEAARLLSISPKTLRGHVAKGELVYRKIGLGSSRPRLRFARDDIEEFLERRKCRSPGSVSPKPTLNVRHAGIASVSTVTSFTELKEQRARERAARLQKKRGGQ